MTDATITNPLPHNDEAERFILGALILDQDGNDLLARTAATLTAGDFFKDRHRLIYHAMIALADRNGNGCIDPVSLADVLQSAGDLDRVGGMVYIAGLFDGVPRFSNIDNYIRIVKETAATRALIHRANAIMARAFDGEMGVSAQIDAARKEIAGVEDPQARSSFQDVGSAAVETLDYIEALQASDREMEGVATGFLDLDCMLGGLPVELVIVGGRPGMGKTAFACGLAERAAFSPHNGNPLIPFFSLEMSGRQLMKRLQCGRAGVDSTKIRRKILTKDDFRQLAKATEDLTTRRIVIDDSPYLTPNILRASLRKLQDQYGEKPAFAIIDYIQYMHADGSRREGKRLEVTEISHEVKSIVKEFGIPIVALASLSRAPESASDKRPTMAALRESGDLESDAGLILFPHRPWYYEKERPQPDVEECALIVEKNRDGETGMLPMSYARRLARFGDYFAGAVSVKQAGGGHAGEDFG